MLTPTPIFSAEVLKRVELAIHLPTLRALVACYRENFYLLFNCAALSYVGIDSNKSVVETVGSSLLGFLYNGKLKARMSVFENMLVGKLIETKRSIVTGDRGTLHNGYLDDT